MIVNFTLDKISVDKKKNPKGTIEAKNSIKFLDVSELALPNTIKDKSLVTFKFQYKVIYTPDVAETEIVGTLHFMTDPKTKDQILKDWQKDSKINQNLSTQLVNYVFSRCGVMALSLCRKVDLPPHIPLPKISIKQKTEVEGKKDKPKAS
jgi:hypothetical protein